MYPLWGQEFMYLWSTFRRVANNAAIGFRRYSKSVNRSVELICRVLTVTFFADEIKWITCRSHTRVQR